MMFRIHLTVTATRNQILPIFSVMSWKLQTCNVFC